MSTIDCVLRANQRIITPVKMDLQWLELRTWSKKAIELQSINVRWLQVGYERLFQYFLLCNTFTRYSGVVT